MGLRELSSGPRSEPPGRLHWARGGSQLLQHQRLAGLLRSNAQGVAAIDTAHGGRGQPFPARKSFPR